jgi:hypothetical protein
MRASKTKWQSCSNDIQSNNKFLVTKAMLLTGGLAKCGLDKPQLQLLFFHCAVVVGGDGTLLIKKFYLEL